MPIVVKTIGIIIVCIAAIWLFNPAFLRKVAEFWKQGKRLYIAAAIRIFAGALLITAAFSCSVFWFVLAVGIILFLSGIIMIGLGLTWMIAYIDKMLLKSDKTLRLVAVIVLLLGAALIYTA